MYFWKNFFVVIAVFFVSQGHAAPTPGTSQETVTPRPPAVAADLYGWGYSGAFSDPDGRRVTPSGAPGDPIEVGTQVIFHSPRLTLGNMELTAVSQFSFVPNEGAFVRLQDPLIGVQGTVYEGSGFSYWARYGVTLPLTSKSQAAGNVLQPLALSVLGYQIPNTRLKAELVLIPQLTFKNSGYSVFWLYTSPRLYYQFSPSFWLVTLLETSMEGSQKTGTFDLAQGTTNLGLGFRYTTANGKGLWIQPFLNLYPWSTVSVASTSHVGAFFGGPLF